MSSYGQMKSESTGLYLKIKEGKPATVHIITPSKEVVHNFVHFPKGKPKEICNRTSCVYCQEGDKPKERWKIVVYNWDEKTPQIFEFGTMIFNGIKDIASVLEEDGSDIHSVDLKVIARGEGLNTEYSVIQKPMKEELPENLVLPKLTQDKDDVPF